LIFADISDRFQLFSNLPAARCLFVNSRQRPTQYRQKHHVTPFVASRAVFYGIGINECLHFPSGIIVGRCF
jgi:hypothetical protein